MSDNMIQKEIDYIKSKIDCTEAKIDNIDLELKQFRQQLFNKDGDVNQLIQNEIADLKEEKKMLYQQKNVLHQNVFMLLTQKLKGTQMI